MYRCPTTPRHVPVVRRTSTYCDMGPIATWEPQEHGMYNPLRDVLAWCLVGMLTVVNVATLVPVWTSRNHRLEHYARWVGSLRHYEGGPECWYCAGSATAVGPHKVPHHEWHVYWYPCVHHTVYSILYMYMSIWYTIYSISNISCMWSVHVMCTCVPIHVCVHHTPVWYVVCTCSVSYVRTYTYIQ